jgi:threonine synthase
MLSGIRLTVSSLVLCVATSAAAQSNLDKGKTGVQLYASSCAGCHKSPQSVSKTTVALGLESFLREHYAATPESAATIAVYLKGLEKQSVGSTRGRVAKRTTSQAKRQPKPSESKQDDSLLHTMQRAFERLLQGTKPENN